MAEAITHLLLIFGNPLAYRIGRLIILMMTLGRLSIEPLPRNFPAHFVQAFDDEKVTPDQGAEHFNVSSTKTIAVGYFVILSLFGIVLYLFRDSFISTKI